MEPITAAILAALPALGSELVKSGVKDAYEGLKAVIQRKWGAASPISKAISALEQDPKSDAQAAVVAEKAHAAKASEDTDVAQALQRLVEQLKAEGLGGGAVSSIQFNMSGGVVQGAAGVGTLHVGSMSFGEPPKRK